jgi:Ca2+:H+ antiporter
VSITTQAASVLTDKVSCRNAVLLICSIFLLTSNQVETLKTSLVGNILTTNLLNTGVAFCAGGYQRQEQFFNKNVVRTMKTLLLVTVIALAMPTASALLSATPINVITRQSRGTAFILIVTYCLFMFFEFGTHKLIFNTKGKKSDLPPAITEGAIHRGLALGGALGAAHGRPSGSRLSDSELPLDQLVQRDAYERLKDVRVEARLHLGVCFAVLILGSATMSFNSQFMIESIRGLTLDAGLPSDFIGLVLLPILSNDLAAIQLAMHDEMDLAIHAALGKSLQVTLVVTPILVIVGWGLGIEDMNLLFDGFQVVTLFASVLLVQIGIEAGKSNW